jgi:hypothetical protein
MAVILAVFTAALEFAGDYGEAFEGTALAVMPDGHSADDGHQPGEHGLRCDNCHLGGIHLIGFTVASISAMPRATPVPAAGPSARLAEHRSAPPSPPPIA